MPTAPRAAGADTLVHKSAGGGRAPSGSCRSAGRGTRGNIGPWCRRSLVWLAGLAAAALAVDDAAGRIGAPKLFVVLVVDQMRADYIDRYRHQWTSGLKRLVEQGAWFRQAAYPYVDTLTCPGHATIATGSFPPRHGIIENTWWDREGGRLVNCADDRATPSIGYTAPVANGYSIHQLLLPTLTDELRAQAPQQPRIVSLSLKPRSAIMMAGRQADVVLWFQNHGTWASSAAYGAAPVGFVHDFVTANPVEHDLAEVWTRLLADGAYLYEDEGPGERPPQPRRATFPHTLRGTTPQRSYELWTKSPFADAYLGRLAVAAIGSLELGQGERSDFLHVGFSSLELVGHDFGPWSHEVQDLLVRLDRTTARCSTSSIAAWGATPTSSR